METHRRFDQTAGAVLLGILWFPPAMLIGETSSGVALFLFLAVYFFGSQWFLSRGRARAHRADITLMLALNAGMIALTLIVAVVEKPAALVPTLLMLLCSGFATYAGALVASFAARRAAGPPMRDEPPAGGCSNQVS